MQDFETIADGLRAFAQTPGAVLLDVRTPDEYRQGHIPGSVNCPLERLSSYDGDPAAPIFAYCRSGARSARAAAQLREMDYDAANIGGVMNYFGPVERSPRQDEPRRGLK